MELPVDVLVLDVGLALEPRVALVMPELPDVAAEEARDEDISEDDEEAPMADDELGATPPASRVPSTQYPPEQVFSVAQSASWLQRLGG